MNQSRIETLLLMLMVIVILLMISIAILFVRMTQLQQQVLTTLGSVELVETVEGLEIGSQAPNFALSNTQDQEISLVDWLGQKTLLVFSSTRCPACAEVYHPLKVLDESTENVQILMISLGTPEENRQLAEEEGYGFPVLTWEDETAGRYEVPGTPFFYVIDNKGFITNKGFAHTLEQLEELIGDEQ